MKVQLCDCGAPATRRARIQAPSVRGVVQWEQLDVCEACYALLQNPQTMQHYAQNSVQHYPLGEHRRRA